MFESEKFKRFAGLDKKIIAPSVLNVPSHKRKMMIDKLIKNGIKWVHYDLMDGLFVDNTAIELNEIIKLRKKTLKHFADVHLMVWDPTPYFGSLIGWVDFITIHIEALDKHGINNLCARFDPLCKQSKTMIGLAINPDTPIETLLPFLEAVDLVLVMSVQPGLGGQKFINESLDKVKALVTLRQKHNYQFLIEIDGGINNQSGPLAFAAGCDIAVSGTYLIKNLSPATITKIQGN